MNGQTKWEVVNPEGIVKIKPLSLNPRSRTLEGKTVLLHWNGKHNGDVFLSKIAELLTKKVRGVRVIKGWETAPDTTAISWRPDISKRFARTLADFKPDIIIGTTGD